MTQEYAFDHAFHNGVFVAQARVVCGGVLSNFWVVHPDWRSPDSHVYNYLGRIRYRERADIAPLETGYRFTYRSTWEGCDGAPVLDEVRHFDLHATAGATICDVTSRKTAAYGELCFEANKHGSVGVRVQPQLLPPFGARWSQARVRSSSAAPPTRSRSARSASSWRTRRSRPASAASASACWS